MVFRKDDACDIAVVRDITGMFKPRKRVDLQPATDVAVEVYPAA
jgi:hypothetical protein